MEFEHLCVDLTPNSEIYIRCLLLYQKDNLTKENSFTSLQCMFFQNILQHYNVLNLISKKHEQLESYF